MSNHLVVDIGTANTVMAVLRDDGKPEVLLNRYGSPFTPSVVAIDASGEIVTGESAQRFALQHPGHVVRSVKRLLEHQLSNPTHHKDSAVGAVPGIGEAQSSALSRSGSRSRSPIEFTAALLDSLKKEAEAQMGNLEDLVLTVPSDSGMQLRAAMVEVGQMAGFDRVQLLDEAIAAVIGAELYRDQEVDRHALVYNLGGGSFAAVLMRLADSQVKVLGMEGDPAIGGDAFDQLIIDYAFAYARDQYGVDLDAHGSSAETTRSEAEQAKIALGVRDAATLHLYVNATGNQEFLQIPLSRDQYESMIRPQIERTIELTFDLLQRMEARYGIGRADIDHVLPIGGSTLTPLVKERLWSEFRGHRVLSRVDPLLCVALGAARWVGASSHSETDSAEADETAIHVNFMDVTANAIGVALGREIHWVIQAETPLPARATLSLQLGEIPPTMLDIPIYEGAGNQRDVSLLGTLEAPLPPDLHAYEHIELEFAVDRGDRVTVSASLPDRGWITKRVLGSKLATPLSRPELERTRAALAIAMKAAITKASTWRGRPDMPCATVDPVHFSVTSPPSVRPGTTFAIYIWAYLKQYYEAVVRRARDAAKAHDVEVQSTGPVRVARGTLLHVHLSIDGLIIDNPESVILWEDDIGEAHFRARVPVAVHPGTCDGQAEISVGGLEIARVYFTVEIGEVVASQAHLQSQVHRHKKAFASYSSKDQEAVLGRIHGMRKAVPQLDVFVDVASLRSGQDWEAELMRVIPTSDVFYLFWSENAKQSEWVEREWRCALSTRGLDFIDPVPLVSPDLVPPPPELAGKHFNDWELAFMRNQQIPPAP